MTAPEANDGALPHRCRRSVHLPGSDRRLGHVSFLVEGRATDQILPMMLEAHSPEWLTGLVMVGALAAFMSTLDSQLLALSSMVHGTSTAVIGALKPH